jgi:hypothetical protein
MIPFGIRLSIFAKNIWHGVLGILAELVLVVVIIASGFLVCIFWWGLFK